MACQLWNQLAGETQFYFFFLHLIFVYPQICSHCEVERFVW